jgi:hypothetical protein
MCANAPHALKCNLLGSGAVSYSPTSKAEGDQYNRYQLSFCCHVSPTCWYTPNPCIFELAVLAEMTTFEVNPVTPLIVH